MDPHLEQMPDHAGPFYQAVRDVLVQNGMPAEQAIQALNNSWTMNHDARILAWDQQAADNAAAAEQQPPQAAAQQQPPRDPEPDDPLPQAQPLPEGNRDEAERRKLKMRDDFDDDSTIADYIAPRPAQYALRRLEDFEYVELWYFTTEGCADATQHQLTQQDDAFGLAKVDNMVTLKPFSSLRASKNVIPDAELNFRQMSMAKNTLIPLMTKFNWSEKAITAFARLFTELEINPLRQLEFGERTLIIYQARARREWHDRLRAGKTFNIGVINDTLLQSTYRELLNKAHVLSINEVSLLSCFPYLFALANHFARFFSPFPFFGSHDMLLASPFRTVTCTMQHAPVHTSQRNSPLAPCHAPYATCTLHLVPRTMHHAPCTMHHAPRTMHHAPRTMHHAPCIMHHPSRSLRRDPSLVFSHAAASPHDALHLPLA